jgi:hypothetical protein
VDTEEFQRTMDDLGGKIYAALQEGRPVASPALELACFLFDWGRTTPAVRQLIETRPADLSGPQSARLAAELLQDINFDPGFILAPHRIDNLKMALQGVQADLSGLRFVDGLHLRFDEEEYGSRARVALPGQSLLSSGTGVPASAGDDPADSLVAVAQEVQDEIADRFWLVWPECPMHKLGIHPVKAESSAWWHCRADGGHFVARIGSMPHAQTP